jgi:ribosome biogenesis protein BRX1
MVKEDKKNAPIQLIEIGPRFVLNLIKIFTGSFGGPVLYENPEYISPNTLRRLAKQKNNRKYVQRVMTRNDKVHRDTEVTAAMPNDPLADVFVEK